MTAPTTSEQVMNDLLSRAWDNIVDKASKHPCAHYLCDAPSTIIIRGFPACDEHGIPLANDLDPGWDGGEGA